MALSIVPLLLLLAAVGCGLFSPAQWDWLPAARPGPCLAPVHGGSCSWDNPYWLAIPGQDRPDMLREFVALSRPPRPSAWPPGGDPEVARLVRSVLVSGSNESARTARGLLIGENAQALRTAGNIFLQDRDGRTEAGKRLREAGLDAIRVGVEILEMSGRLGCAQAWTDLGLLFLNGDPVNKDPARALRFFTRAAAMGDAEAQFQLFALMRWGGLSLQSSMLPYGHLVQAAANGHPWAMACLGRFQEEKIGDAQGVRTAVALYWRAAEAGVAQAASRLGQMYEEGQGLPRSEAQARAWYEVAANNLDYRAMHHLARMLLGGRGGPRDPQGAAVWANILANCRFSWAGALLQEAEAAASPEQWGHARAAARTWSPRLGSAGAFVQPNPDHSPWPWPGTVPPR